MNLTAEAILTEQKALVSVKPRISSIDVMRGIVMVIMALDHVRHYLHIDATAFEPTDLSQTNPVLFFTRWITHFCAPTFVLLTGTAARISLQRKTKRDLSLFLLSRGFWLILLEVTVIRFSFVFNFYYDFTIFQVIWVIGASMIVLAALVHLPDYIILGIGLILIFGHNLLDTIQLKPGDNGFLAWTFLYQSGFVGLSPQNFIIIPYPLIPWLGILLAGYGMGVLYTKAFSPDKRKRILFFSGLAAITLFVLIRSINIYGDPSPWTQQKDLVFSVISFFNPTKYPVSLLYTLMTLGPVLMILPYMENIRGKWWDPFIVFGRVPLFYYILHFFLIHFVTLAAYMISSGISFTDLDFHFNKGFGGIPANTGYSLGWVYFVWIAVVVVLYPVCKWYNDYKSTHKSWWLSYL